MNLWEIIKWKIAYNLIEDSCQDLLNCIKDKKNVQFFLRLNSSEMKAFYDAIDILLVPSRQDPLPTVAIEAMARKKLVLGSNTGGIPELLGSKRYLFKVEDSSSIETMLSEYCNKDTYEFSSYVEEQWQRAYGLFRSFSKRTYVNSIISGQLKEDRV
nr:glycosyltransferase [Coprococcus comes]